MGRRKVVKETQLIFLLRLQVRRRKITASDFGSNSYGGGGGALDASYETPTKTWT